MRKNSIPRNYNYLEVVFNVDTNGPKAGDRAKVFKVLNGHQIQMRGTGNGMMLLTSQLRDPEIVTIEKIVR